MKKITNKTEESRRGRGWGRSGQVAVRVLLSVHSLQVLLFDQDVDAFLTKHNKMKSTNKNLQCMCPRVKQQCDEMRTLKPESYTTFLFMRYLDDWDSGFESRRQLIQDFSQKLLVLQDLPHLHDPHYGRLKTHIRYCKEKSGLLCCSLINVTIISLRRNKDHLKHYAQSTLNPAFGYMRLYI